MIEIQKNIPFYDFLYPLQFFVAFGYTIRKALHNTLLYETVVLVLVNLDFSIPWPDRSHKTNIPEHVVPAVALQKYYGFEMKAGIHYFEYPLWIAQLYAINIIPAIDYSIRPGNT